jgi:phosphatidylinositol-3-phosphatase
MHRAIKIAAVAGVLALAGSSLGVQAAASDQAQAPTRVHAPRLDHIYVIMLENHSQSSVIGDPNAPYLNKLAHRYQMADRYYGVTHPSMPNYIATIAGDNFGIQDDNVDNVVHLRRHNLVDQLEKHHIRWGAYMQDLPRNKLADNGPVVNGATVALYAKKHNPFVLFDSVKNNPARMRHVKDYSRLGHDLNARHAPNFVWITPNQCNDMHGGVTVAVPGHPETPCGYGNTDNDANDRALKHKADAFVKQAVHTIRSSRAWTHRSAIIIVTDENDFDSTNPTTGDWETAAGCCDSPYVGKGDVRVSKDWPGGTYGGGLIPAIIVSPQAPRHLVDHHRYNHYSLLTTIESNWHMANLGHAGDRLGGVRPMWHAFLG